MSKNNTKKTNIKPSVKRDSYKNQSSNKETGAESFKGSRTGTRPKSKKD